MEPIQKGDDYWELMAETPIGSTRSQYDIQVTKQRPKENRRVLVRAVETSCPGDEMAISFEREAHDSFAEYC